MSRYFIRVYLLFIIGILVSCQDGSSKNSTVNKEDIPSTANQADRINQLEGNMKLTETGLKYKDMVVGDGESPKVGDKVVVHYTGKLEDGTKFDSSVDRGKPFEFSIGVGQVIKGWDEGVMSMRVGGKRQLVIPSNLGYGESGAGKVIPPNATLIFDVELIEIIPENHDHSDPNHTH